MVHGFMANGWDICGFSITHRQVRKTWPHLTSTQDLPPPTTNLHYIILIHIYNYIYWYMKTCSPPRKFHFSLISTTWTFYTSFNLHLFLFWIKCHSSPIFPTFHHHSTLFQQFVIISIPPPLYVSLFLSPSSLSRPFFMGFPFYYYVIPFESSWSVEMYSKRGKSGA